MALKSKLHIETGFRNGKTFLKRSFCNPPFKIADVTEDKSQPVLNLMLMSSSPGVLDEDLYDFEMDVGENSSLHLFTQSYQRLFNMKSGAAQTLKINIGAGASFSYLPHPLVPHEHSIFASKNNIQLSNGAALIWGEVMSCGRKLNGEIFKFSSYHSLTQIFKNGKLLVKENLLMKPLQINPFAIGQMEGYTHQATVIFIEEKTNISELIEQVHLDLKQQTNIAFGVSALPGNGIIVRFLGYSAEHLFSLVKQTAGSFGNSNSKKEFKSPAHAL